MTKAGSKNNRSRGTSDERDAAHETGGRRHPANTGGAEDVAHPHYAIQVKGGKTVTTTTFRSGMTDAIVAAGQQGKVPLLFIVDRSGSRIQRYVAMPAEDFATEFLLCDVCFQIPSRHPRTFEAMQASREPFHDHMWAADVTHHVRNEHDYADWLREQRQRKGAGVDTPSDPSVD